jgi:hypothetical protein
VKITWIHVQTVGRMEKNEPSARIALHLEHLSYPH